MKESLLLLIKNVEVFAPEPLGIKNLLIAGNKVALISGNSKSPEGLDCLELDASGLRLTPGFIDAHVHIAGAGGEGGPATRTPEIFLSDLLEAGVTTVIGCLGTDGMTRSLESVLMKVKALRTEGISAWMYSGAYQVPTPTLTGDIGKDLALIEEVIGAGEIALSDHRSSVPTVDELIRLAEHTRVGGMLGGKAGIVNIHMGDARDPFRPILEAVANSELPIKQFYPTHCNRNQHIYENAKEYGKKSWIDLTSSSYDYFPEDEIKPSEAVMGLLDEGVPLEHITMTSDANGSLPQFNEQGELVRLEMGKPLSLIKELKDLIGEGLPLEKAIRIFSTNPAEVLKLRRKGRIFEGADADLILFDAGLDIKYLLAKGQLMIDDGKIIRRGTYE